MNKSPIVILRDIIKTQMNLNNDRIWVYNQSKSIPTDKELFVVLEFLNSKVYSARNSYIPTNTGMQEQPTMNTVEEYAIKIASVNDDATFRKEEIILALNSDYSIQQQQIYQFRIAQIPNTFLNVSSVEASKMLNRYDIHIKVFAFYSKSNNVSYYNTFGEEIYFG
jgi:hypothetical protein